MADFCKQCSEEIFNEDLGDLAGLCKPAEVCLAICEGCGGTVVDHTGMCVSPDCLYRHGLIPASTIQKLKENFMFEGLDNYQEAAAGTAVYPGAGTNSNVAICYVGFKLAGETGEVLEKIAKYRWRYDPLPPGWQESDRDEYTRRMVKKELGDVLWYISAMAREFNLTLSEIAKANIEGLADRKARGVLKGSGDER